MKLFKAKIINEDMEFPQEEDHWFASTAEEKVRDEINNLIKQRKGSFLVGIQEEAEEVKILS